MAQCLLWRPLPRFPPQFALALLIAITVASADVYAARLRAQNFRRSVSAMQTWGRRVLGRQRGPADFGRRHQRVPGRVQQRTQRAIRDGAMEVRKQGKTPLLQIDLDLTGLLPVDRTVAALQLAGDHFGIPELRNPTKNFATLPGYTTGAFRQWLSSSGLLGKYPGVDWGDLSVDGQAAEDPNGAFYQRFRHAYWQGDLRTDKVAPGLRDFVQWFENDPAIRGKVVFNSGRGGELRDASIEALRRGGIEISDNRPLFIGKMPGKSDAELKQFRQTEFENLGVTVAVIDDRAGNGQAVQQANPGALVVAAFAPGFSFETGNRRARYRLSTFFRSRLRFR